MKWQIRSMAEEGAKRRKRKTTTTTTTTTNNSYCSSRLINNLATTTVIESVIIILGAVVLCLPQQLVSGLENGLARTPPMGWMAWARFTCELDCKRFPRECINSALFMRMADHLFADGWLSAGYQHVNIDDCWSEMSRDPKSEELMPSEERFHGSPGMLELANYVHKYDGLKLGIYGDCGTQTCAGYPAQLKPEHYNESLRSGGASSDDNFRTSTYFELDARTFAGWHVDALKFDGCYVNPVKAERICSHMAVALAEAKRPIMLSCEWPFYMMYAHEEADWDLTAASCNMWRYYDDIEDSWLSVLNTIDHTIRHQSTMVKYHGPGHWFDPDQLVIGNFGLSVAQARAQMALWCIWSAPLYMSNDLGAIKQEFVEILQNRHLIAIDQDKLGVLGLMTRQSSDGQLQAFVKPIEPISARTGCPSFAIVYLNRKTLGNHQKVSFGLADLLLGAPIRQAAKNQASVWDFEVTHGPYGTRSRLSASEELEQLLSAAAAASGKKQQLDVGETDQFGKEASHVGLNDATLPRRSDAIQASECLKLLAKARTNSTSGGGSGSGSKNSAIQFELFDLFEDNKSLGTLSPHESLELLVSPSSVRAVKLIESSQE